MAYSISTRERVWSRTSTCTSTAPAVVDAVPLPDPAGNRRASAPASSCHGALAVALPLIAVLAFAMRPLVMGPSLSLEDGAGPARPRVRPSPPPLAEG